MAIDKIFDGAVDGIADNLFNSVSNSVSEIKAMQQRKAAENVQLVVQALKKIDADIREKYDGVTETIEKRVANIKDGRDGIDGKNGLDGVNGKDGRDGKDGRNGRDGLTGPRGFDGPKGADGKDGRDGEDGVSVTDAHIDFDGSLIISLSSGRVINVGEVVSADIAEKIKVITNGGGTSQPVLDQLASLQAQIDLISSALVYKGTWNASTNTPTLTSSVGTANTFYIVSVAGTTNLNGTSNWGVGDWAVYNGSVWQRIEGGAVGNFTDLSVSGTTTLSGLTASTALALNASKQVVSVTNTGSGNNVLATSPTLVTPVLGTPSSVTLTNATGLPLSTGVTGTLPIANGGTGATTANTAFNALAPSQTGNSGKYLTTNGTSTSWATVASGTVTSVSGTGTVNGLTLTGTVTTSGSLTLGGTLSGISNASLTNSSITINGTATSLGGSISVGTVTSVAATVPSFLSITGSPITSSGTLAISLSGTALPTTSGGTGLTSFTANGVVYASSSSALTTGSALTFDGSKLVNTGYNKSTYQVSTNTVGTFESVGAAYLSYDSATGASIYSRSNATAENILNLRASTFSFKIGGTQVSSLDSSSFSLYNTPILLSGSTSGYTGFAAPATSNFTIYTLPSSDGTSGQSLVTNGSGTLSWASGTGGTVTSVSGTGTVSGISLSGTVTSSGNLTLGGALDLSAYGGAGAFTTLSASSTVTLSGGTANGVAYLNGSKVVTSGSALTFNGTAFINKPTSDSNPVVARFGVINSAATDDAYLDISADAANNLVTLDSTGNNTGSLAFKLGGSEQMRLTSTGLGIGTSSPTAKLDVTGTFNGTQAVFGYTSGRGLLIGTALNGGVNEGSTVLNARGAGNGQFLFQTDGTTRVTISDSGNVGIGTSSPSYKLDVVAAGGVTARVQNTASTADAYFLAQNTVGSGFFGINATGPYIYTAQAIPILFYTSGSERMRLDSSGNLGLTKLALNIDSPFITGANISSGTNPVALGTTGSANIHFFTANSERARITSSGSLLVGATSAFNGELLQVSRAGTVSTTDFIYSSAPTALIQTPNNGVDNKAVLMLRAAYTDGSFSAGSISVKTDAQYRAQMVLTYDADASGGYFAINQFYPTASNTFERARFDSFGNFGIGTSSPVAKLDVYQATAGSNAARFAHVNGNGIYLNPSYNYYDAYNHIFRSLNGTTTYATIDNSGNLGLGVTPSAWSGYKPLQAGSAASFGGYAGDVLSFMGSNTYNDNTNWKYILSGNAAARYQQSAGIHAWYNAPSGTAGNAITFTQAMTLDASGNFMVGGTTASRKVTITDTATGGNIQGIRIVGNAGNYYDIGRVSDTGEFTVTGNQTGVPLMTWVQGGSERMRIDSSGNFLVGTTSNGTYSEKFNVTTGSATQTIMNLVATGTSSFGAVKFRNGSGEIGSISYLSSGVVYNTSSDYRLKNITGALTGYKERLMSLQPKQGTWKVDGSEFRGFLAHEFANPYRASVTGEKDAVDEDGNPIMQGMQASSSEVMADLVALVQEQQAIINSLKARLDAANL